MAIDATNLDAATRAAPRVPESAPLSAIIRSPTEEPYNETCDMSFGDFLDIINPLQHIPIIGSIYRGITGDTIKAPASTMGGILWGGPLGLLTTMVDSVIEQATGKGIEGNMLAAVGIGSDTPGTAVAQSATPAGTSAAAPQVAAATPDGAPTADLAAALIAAPATGKPPVQTAALSGPAAGAAPTLANSLANPLGNHRPSRMPARDTMLASTLQAKHAASLNAPRPGAAAALAAAKAPEKTQADKTASDKTAPGKATAEAAPAPVPPEMLSDVMMRNLAKYEAAKKASFHNAPSNVRVSG